MANGTGSRTDDGYFPASTSVMRRVMDERMVGLWYGQRALILGALEPMAFTGTYESSPVRDHGGHYQRMTSTYAMFSAVIHGTRAEADAALRRVGGMHRQVGGTVDHDLGPAYPAGSSYSAHDPWLAYWTMAVLADSATALYETFVGPLSDDDKERAWQDWLLFARLFGMPHDAAPGTWAGHRALIDAWIDSDVPHVLPKARRGGLSVISLELPLPLRPMNDLAYLIVAGTLSPRVRELLDLPWRAHHAAGLLALRTATRAGRRVTPDMIATGTLTPLFAAAADIADRGNPTTIASAIRRALPV